MLVDGQPMRTIWPSGDRSVAIIDQTRLPHELIMVELKTLDDAAHAINTMQVRGAPLIGATAAYGLALALKNDSSDASLDHAIRVLAATRPTAINLRWALDRAQCEIRRHRPGDRVPAAWRLAAAICDEDVDINRTLGQHGLTIVRAADNGTKPVNQRDVGEVTHVSGRLSDGRIESVQVTPEGSPAANYAFDVTPARLVTGLITERGVCAASRDGLLGLFPERRMVAGRDGGT
jgi:methylthioribose-1-phosphate isomerase